MVLQHRTQHRTAVVQHKNRPWGCGWIAVGAPQQGLQEQRRRLHQTISTLLAACKLVKNRKLTFSARTQQGGRVYIGDGKVYKLCCCSLVFRLNRESSGRSSEQPRLKVHGVHIHGRRKATRSISYTEMINVFQQQKHVPLFYLAAPATQAIGIPQETTQPVLPWVWRRIRD